MPTPIKIHAKVETVIPHGEGVKSFIITPMKRCPCFKLGQFLHLAIDEYDPSFHWPEGDFPVVWTKKRPPANDFWFQERINEEWHFGKQHYDR